MTPAILILSALACLLLALALWLLTGARRKEHHRSMQSHLQRSLEMQLPQDGALPGMPGMPPAPTAQRTADSLPSHPLLQRLQRHLSLEAWGIAPTSLIVLSVLGLLLCALAALQGGWLLGLLALLAYGLLCSFGIWRRLNKRREKLLQQLPGLLDNMVRLITIGNSPHAAFQLAIGNVPAPLGDALQQAAATLSTTPDLGHAMSLLERNWRLPEFGLLAAVFRMSTRYGGRSDQVLERVSAYIRDRQSAERELHALSAEIRLSAWVLALLPIVIGGLIMVLNSGYFMRMWEDDTGRKMVLAAAGLEAFGSFLLYRLARLR